MDLPALNADAPLNKSFIVSTLETSQSAIAPLSFAKIGQVPSAGVSAKQAATAVLRSLPVAGTKSTEQQSIDSQLAVAHPPDKSGFKNV